MNELDLIAEADRRARTWTAGIPSRPAFPGQMERAGLEAFDEAFPATGLAAEQTLQLLDEAGSPATVGSNGPRYFGFVHGATLPVAAAAERLVLAWDQNALSALSSPVAAAVEGAAARFVLQALELPSDSGVSFGTSASACGLAALTTARRHLLARKGWNFDRDGLHGAPRVRFVVSGTAHVTVLKAVRIMGVGLGNVELAPVDPHGRVDPERLPPLDDMTVLCLQAGEVNTGEFDPFEPLIARARDAGAWVHVDGAFGLWARASQSLRHHTLGVDGADSWTTDGHKWLNTPYDGAMAIVRDASALSATMNSDAAYATAGAMEQKNLGLEFSRRARGIAIWAALRTLGRDGLSALVERHCRQARRLADGMQAAGLEVVNRVVLNQVLVRGTSDEETRFVRDLALETGDIWFGPSTWEGRAAFRLSVCSWRTTDDDIEWTIDRIGSAAQRARRIAGTDLRQPEPHAVTGPAIKGEPE